MTVIINVGRRVPKSWFRRQANKAAGLLTFQENIWLIILQSLNLAKKKANASGKAKFVSTKEYEDEDMNYQLEWIKIKIQATEEVEEEEYNESMQLYHPLGKILKKDFPKNDRMKSHFKTKVLSKAQVEEAYKKGYGALNDNNMANKLLEMGILTYVEWIPDYETRTKETDF